MRRSVIPKRKLAIGVALLLLASMAVTLPADAAKPKPPAVVTGAATSVTETTATVNGTVNPQGRATTAWFDYGLTTSYGQTTGPITVCATGCGNSPRPVSANLTGLSPGTIYHFRLRATNNVGSTNGGDVSFTTVTVGGPPTELLVGGGFEGSYSGIAPNWSENVWGGAGTAYARTTTNPHGGTSAQQITVTGTVGDNDNGAIYFQPYTFAAGVTYQGSIWLRASAPMTVQFGFRRAGAFYEFAAIKSVTVGTLWQQVTIQGGWPEPVPAYVGINMLQTGTLFVDDASLTMLPVNNAVASPAAIPDRLFGMHINQWGTYSPPTWPVASEFETSRLWDTATTWADIETSDGVYDWVRLDMYVAEADAAGQDIIWNPGKTPGWAGPASTLPPTNTADWTNFIETVINRYPGKIKYVEVWNEVDPGNFWTGTIAQMQTLAQAAYTAIKAIDPTIQVLTPNITALGLSWLDRYLHAGGGAYADIVSYHWGIENSQVELYEPRFRGLFNLVANHGLSKPSWNTETQVQLVDTTTQNIGAVSRLWMLGWLWGFSNLNWYAWDIYGDDPIDYVALSESSDRQTLTAAGVAYRETGRWLKGAQMTTKAVDANGCWVLTLTRAGGYVGRVVWSPNGPRTFTIPTEWGVTRKRDLAGTVTGQGSGAVTASYQPVLYENQAP